MSPDDDTLDYRAKADSATDPVRAPRRSLGTWVILWLVWAVGLVVWAAYVVAIVLIVSRIMS